MASRFRSLPPLPMGIQGVPPALTLAISALLENVGMLTGERGSANNAALVKGDVTVPNPDSMKLRSLTAQGLQILVPDASGTGTVAVVPVSDYVRLLNDVENLRKDVTNLRDTVEILVRQLKA